MKAGPLPFASNAADYEPPDFEVLDEDTEEAFVLTDVDEITIRVRNPLVNVIEITHTLTGGDIILVDSDFKFRWIVRAATMANLVPGTYDVSVIIEEGDDTRAAFLGTLSVLDGVGF